jgi:hypothetical protein
MIGSTKASARISWVLGCLVCVAALVALLTFTSAAAAECVNEALRRESNPDPTTAKPYSVGLPDCRAYEMVSPLYKQERDTEGISLGSQGLPVASGGDAAGWGSVGAFSDPENVLLLNMPYLSQRAAFGWSTSSVFAPAALVAKPLGGGTGSDSSPDLRSVHVTCGASPLEKGQRGTTATFTVACARREGAGSWTSTPAYTYVGSAAHLSYYMGGSADLTRVFLSPEHPLLTSDTVSVEGQAGIYEIAGCCESSSMLRLVNVDDNGDELVVRRAHRGEPTELQGPYFADWRPAGGADGSAYHAISPSGGTVFFTATPNSAKPAEAEVLTVYARVNCGTDAAHSSAPSCKEDMEGGAGEWFETVPVSSPSHQECNQCLEGAVRQNATFQGASADGTKVFFTTTQQLLDHDNTYNLYEYDFAKPEGEKLTLLSTDAASAAVAGVLRISADGSHVYFVAEGVLNEEPNGNGEKAGIGQDNVYGYDTVSGETKFVARIAGEILSHIGSAVSRDGERRAQTTPDGRYLVFSSAGSLAGDLNTSAAQAVYRYDFQTGGLTWVSHGAPQFKVEDEGEAGYKGEGKDALVSPLPGTLPSTAPISADANVEDWTRAISNDGEYIIFSAPERLQADDVNGAPDVYEWHDGIVSMLSDGHDPEGVLRNVVALSSSGSDVFFTTGTGLVGQDTDVLRDVYDARMNRCGDEEESPVVGVPEAEAANVCQDVGGKVALAGFPRPEAPSSCSDEGCQGPLSPSEAFVAAASSVFTNGQNLTPPLVSVAPSMQARPKRLTRAQRLAKALKACRARPKRKRRACESQARKKYGGRTALKKKAKARK